MHQIDRHTHACAQMAAEALGALTHYNGAKVVELYGNWRQPDRMGSIVAFNCYRADGAAIGFAEVS